MTVDWDWTNLTNAAWDTIVFFTTWCIFGSWTMAGFCVIIERTALEGEALARLELWQDGNGGNWAEWIVGLAYFVIGIWLQKLG